ncbi:YopJ family acetyltransferase [Paracidovorax konjaci]|uniref:YopJ Serine/Threonine acetyltransferase n=1 Tax=Paracidovorax konjaci TaxID=32040 RepID=A0A1I1TGS5_9BURK|nr:YopJ family acetyltransferase [Paracidovorax konjaci]SFD56358.1 YopJ Serine/Threonine acetyltransferase [Paracidovorax konjaci]
MRKINHPGFKISIQLPVAAPAAQDVEIRGPSGSLPALSSPGISPRTRAKSEKTVALDAEIQKVRADINAHRQPDLPTLQSDLSNVQSIVHAQNVRKPGLALSYHASAESLVEAMHAMDPNRSHRFRSVFRVDHRPGGVHHAVVDVRMHPGHPPTVIAVEPATMGAGTNIDSYANFVDLLRSSPGMEHARVFIIDAEAQKSGADCVMFGLTFASHMHKESGLLDQWHERLAQDLQLAENVQSDRLPSGVAILDGQKFLPPAFFKHAHSLTRTLEVRPELADAVVGHGPDGSPETLGARKERFTDRRITERGEKMTSASIDYKRHDYLKKTLETLAKEMP